MSVVLMMTASLFVALLGFSTVSATSPYYGESVGSLTTISHQVSGDVFVFDERRIRLRNFVYDGNGPAAYFWVGLKGTAGANPDSSGIVVPNENGNTSRLGRYDNADIVLTLPSSLLVNELRWLSIWCEEFAVNFGHVSFPNDIRVPQPTVIGQFSASGQGISSGNVTVVDVQTVSISSFTCVCTLRDIQIVGIHQNQQNDIVILERQNSRTDDLDTASQLRVELTVPAPTTATQFHFIAVYSKRNNRSLARVTIPPSLYVPPTQQAADMYYGEYLGPFPSLAHELGGDVYLMDERRFRVRNFHYDGTAPAVYFWVGRRGEAGSTPDTSGIPIPDMNNRLLRRYSNEEVFVSLPDSMTVRDIVWLSVWCIKFTTNFGHVLISSDVRVPTSAEIGQFSDTPAGISSGTVTIVDVETVVVESFSCGNCQEQDVEFVGGFDSAVDSLVVFPQDGKSEVNLGEARSASVQVSVPQSMNIHDFQVLAVYSSTGNTTLATIGISRTLLVPPFISDDDDDDDTPTSFGTSTIQTTAVLAVSVALIDLWWWW